MSNANKVVKTVRPVSGKADKTQAQPTPVATVAPEALLTTKHIAAKFGLKPVVLRRVLRSMTEYADGVHTNYRWAGYGDPAIARIEAAIAARSLQRSAAQQAAQAALVAAKAQAAAQAQADTTAAKSAKRK